MVRVRIAPSPTGSLHVGNARTALFNFLYARQNKGSFILRMEDTDADRSTKESEVSMIKDFEWLGLTFDEGPTMGGDYGPYRQTERLDIYKGYTEQLLKSGDAYPCFCSTDHIQKQREEAQKNSIPYQYDKTCRNLNPQDVKDRLDAGEPHAIRFAIKQDTITINDMIRGDINFDTNSFGDFLIVRPDGMPIFNYVVVIDDHLMNITHVVRGDDHLSNTPKHALVFKALGFDVPEFAHIPMIVGKDHAKLSKRHGDTTVANFREKGYLKEALINYLALLSWSSKTEREIFTIGELVKEFNLLSVSKSAAVFDVDKLNWMNGLYIRELSSREYYQLSLRFVKESKLFIDGHITQSHINDEISFTTVLLAIRDNLEVLQDIGSYLDPFFIMPGLTLGVPAVKLSAEAMEILALPTSKNVLVQLLSEARKVTEKQIDTITFKEITKGIQQTTGARGKALFMAIRIGISGEHHGPDMATLVSLLPTRELVARVEYILTEHMG